MKVSEESIKTQFINLDSSFYECHTFRPDRSTNNVDTYVPTNWIIATIIADDSSDKVEPDSANIVVV